MIFVNLDQKVINQFDDRQKNKYDKLSNSYYFLNKKYENSLKKIKQWNKLIKNLNIFETNIFDKKGNVTILKTIKDEEDLIDNLELFLFRTRDLLDLLFSVTSLITEITDKKNVLAQINTTKILKGLESNELISDEFNNYKKNALEGIKIIIDMRNSLKLNGSSSLILQDNKIYFSQRRDNIKGNPLRSKNLGNLGKKLFDNWLVSLDEFKKTIPKIISEYVNTLNNFKLNNAFNLSNKNE